MSGLWGVIGGTGLSQLEGLQLTGASLLLRWYTASWLVSRSAFWRVMGIRIPFHRIG